MKKRVWAMGAAVMMMGALTACAGGSDSKAASTQAEESGTEAGKGAVSESEGDDTETRQAERTDETSEGGTFTVGFDQDFPPMGFVGEDGEYTGFDLELLRRLPRGWGLPMWLSLLPGMRKIWSWSQETLTVSGTALP